MRLTVFIPLFAALALSAPLPAMAQKVEARICAASADIVTQVAGLRRDGRNRNRAEREALAALTEETSVLRPAVYLIVNDVYGWSDKQLAGYDRADWLAQCTGSS